MNINFDSKGPRSKALGRKYLSARTVARAGLVAAACGMSGWGSAAWAQGAPTRTVYFYSGAGQSEAKAGGWGNGVAAKSRDINYESADALQVTTRNLNEGIRFDLAQPVDIAPYLAPGANGLVRLRVRFASPFGGAGGGYPGGGGGYPGGGGGYPGGGGGYPGGGGGYPGGGGGGYPGGGGGYPGGGGGYPGGGGYTGVDARQVSPALAQPASEAGADVGRSSALPRVLGEARTYGLAQYGSGSGSSSGYPGGGYPGGGGGYPGGGGGYPGAGGGYPGGGGGYPGAGGGYPGGGTGMMQRTAIERFQVTMVLDNGTISGGKDFSAQRSRPDDAGWYLLTVPLSEMKATQGASGRVRRVIITTDKEDTWYLGQAALAVDPKQIAISLRQAKDAPGTQVAEVTVAPGPITLVADVEAGASDVVVTWNFDADNAGAPAIGAGVGGPNEVATGADPRGGGYPGAGGGYPGGGDPRGGGGYPGGGYPGGGGGYPGSGGGYPGGEGIGFGGPRVDARGLIGKFTYPNEEQNYRVEVTVRDRSPRNAKKEVKASILVKVRG